MPSCEVSDNAVNIDIRISTIRTVAGNGTAGLSGEGGPAIAASLNEPKALTLDGRDNLLIADSENHVIRKVDRENGIIVTVAGCSARQEPQLVAEDQDSPAATGDDPFAEGAVR